MLKEERQQQILGYLQTHGRVLAGELSKQLGVSVDTIRRDLRELSESGKMQRVHGGALPRSPVAGTYQERAQQWPETKAAIARAALRLIHDGQVILLDGGTTTLQVAQRLPLELRATLVTNSPLIAAALADHPCSEVILIGGRLYKNHASLPAPLRCTPCSSCAPTCACWGFAVWILNWGSVCWITKKPTSSKP